eukprot:17991-Eustigmatos_ZCMA.PRE.1
MATDGTVLLSLSSRCTHDGASCILAISLLPAGTCPGGRSSTLFYAATLSGSRSWLSRMMGQYALSFLQDGRRR